jgi:RNA polymerase sigma-70 factor (ECF subfamily)
MADLDDHELVGLVLGGEDGAFRVLVERYEQVVAATVIRMLGPGDDAEDVGQETFIRFYRAIETFRGEASVKTFLTRIAMNLSLNALKRRRRMASRFVSRDQADSPLPEPVANGNASVEAHEIHDVVTRAIHELKPKHRAVVVLRMIEGYSTRETAEILGIPEGTVLSRLARGMDALEPLLQPYGADDER